MRSGSTASSLSWVSRVSSDYPEPIKPQPATITRLGAPIHNFQYISRFFVTFQCESVIIILLSYQSSCSLIHTLLAAIIYCCFVNYSILHQVKRPEQSIAGHFGCAHCSPGSLWRWASWLVPFICQLPWTKLSDHWIYTVGCKAGTLAWSFILEHTQHTPSLVTVHQKQSFLPFWIFY